MPELHDVAAIGNAIVDVICPATDEFLDAHGLTKGIAPKNRQHFEAKGVGHYGIFSGRKYRELIYPRIRDFIARNS